MLLCFKEYDVENTQLNLRNVQEPKDLGIRASTFETFFHNYAGSQTEDFSSNLCVQTGSGAHPDSCTVGTGGSFPGGKARPGHDADHSPPSSAEVKKE
jgi:hypothetical protein